MLYHSYVDYIYLLLFIFLFIKIIRGVLYLDISFSCWFTAIRGPILCCLEPLLYLPGIPKDHLRIFGSHYDNLMGCINSTSHKIISQNHYTYWVLSMPESVAVRLFSSIKYQNSLSIMYPFTDLGILCTFTPVIPVIDLNYTYQIHLLFLNCFVVIALK